MVARARLSEFLHLVNAVAGWISAGLALAVVLLTAIAAVGRYTELMTTVWIPELREISFLWLVFLGSAVAFYNDYHFKMTGLVERAGPRFVRASTYYVPVVVAAFGVILFWFGLGMSALAGERVTPTFGIPYTLIYAVVPISGALTFVNALGKLFPPPDVDDK